ncbi:Rv3235 family protein [Nesterenkonia aurantiaca]|uniref:Rv3235 family protein n=1 Tax=Nesterenkonia aurantiaca TaxID=1436010 RepID=UPI003EE6B84F
MSVNPAGQQPPSQPRGRNNGRDGAQHRARGDAREDPLDSLRAFLDADPQLRGRTTVIPAPGSSGPGQGSAERGGYRLQREDEVPALMRRLRGERGTTAERGAPGEPPTTLASYREERRQICAISRIVCQVTTEVLQGLRPAAQLQRWLDPEVQQKVTERARLLTETRRASPGAATGTGNRGAGTHTIPRPQPLTFGHLRAERLVRGVWEVSVVFGDGKRIRACALRIEAHRRRWRVVAMELG